MDRWILLHIINSLKHSTHISHSYHVHWCQLLPGLQVITSFHIQLTSLLAISRVFYSATEKVGQPLASPYVSDWLSGTPLAHQPILDKLR